MIDPFIVNLSYVAQNGKNGDSSLMVSPGIISARRIAPVLNTAHGLTPGSRLSSLFSSPF